MQPLRISGLLCRLLGLLIRRFTKQTQVRREVNAALTDKRFTLKADRIVNPSVYEANASPEGGECSPYGQSGLLCKQFTLKVV